MQLGFAWDDGLVYIGSKLLITARLLESRGPVIRGRAGLETLPADYRLV